MLSMTKPFVNRYALLLFVILTSMVSRAGINGIVRDANMIGIGGASIIIYSQNDKIIAYTTSKSDGSFFCQKNTSEARYVIVRHIGYKPQRVVIENSEKQLIVVLEQSEIGLGEVVVKSRPIRQDNDTTRYIVGAFSDGHERNVEELLKKLPGIDVSENGSVSFKGKPVSKVLLDKTDMFGENYKPATRTISPQYIGTVEAIEHYQDNRHLKNVQASDDVVLNLSLKSGTKLQKPTGVIDVAGGTSKRYDIHGSVISLNNKFKLYDAAAFSNISLSDWCVQDSHDNALSAEVISDHFDMMRDRDNVKTTNQRCNANVLNAVCQPTERFVIKDQFVVEGNRQTAGSNEVINYIDGNTTLHRHISQKRSPFVIDNNIEAKYDCSKSTILTVKNRVCYKDKDVSNLIADTLSSEYDVNNQMVYVSSNVNISHLLKNNSVLIFNGNNVVNKGKQMFDYSSLVHQGVNTSYTNTMVSAKYLKKRKNLEYNVEMAYDVRYRSVDCQSESFGDQNVKHDETLLHCRPELKWENASLKIRLATLIGYWQQHLNVTGKGERDLKKIKIMPDLSVAYSFKRHSISADYVFEPHGLDTWDYINHYTDERHVIKTAGVFEGMTESKTALSYIYTPSLSTMLMAMYMYTKSGNVLDYRYLISQDAEIATPYMLSTADRHLGNISLSSYSDVLRHGIKLSVSINSMNYRNCFDDEGPQKVTNMALIPKLSVRSSFGGCVNYMVGGRYTSIAYRRDGGAKSNTYACSFFQELSCRYKMLNAKISIDEHYIGKDHSLYCFITPNVRYDIKKYNASVILSAYNVLNRKGIHEYWITDLYTREYKQEIVPAYYMLSFSCRF